MKFKAKPKMTPKRLRKRIAKPKFILYAPVMQSSFDPYELVRWWLAEEVHIPKIGEFNDADFY